MFYLYLALIAAINNVERVVSEATHQQLSWTQLHNLANLLTLEVSFGYDLHLRALYLHKVQTKLSSESHLQWRIRFHSLCGFVVLRGDVIGFDNGVDVPELRVLDVSYVVHFVVTICLLTNLPS